MYIRVKVTPGAKKELVQREKEDTFVIAVKEKAERNMANKRVLELVAAEYGVSTAKVRLLSGHRSGNKIISLEDDYESKR